MDFYRCAIQRNMLNLYVDHVTFLECCKYAIQYALFGPSIGAGINTMPISEFLR